MNTDCMTLRPIARIHTDFPDKFGVPRQSGLVEALEGEVRFEKEYRRAEALRGLEEFSHIWLLWQFSETQSAQWSPTVRPPRLGGNTRVGVFASRSPFRPNAIALSCVRLLGIAHTEAFGDVLRVSGADMTDGTPIYDIKPYLPYADSRPDARGGYSERAMGWRLRVQFPDNLLALVPEGKREALIQVLQYDPRPSYQDDAGRRYGFFFAGMEIKFTVAGDLLTVCQVTDI